MNNVFLILVIFCLSGCTTESFDRSPFEPYPDDSLPIIDLSLYEISSKTISRYPYKAISIKQEGWVYVSFSLNVSGYAKHVSIVDSRDPRFLINQL